MSRALLILLYVFLLSGCEKKAEQSQVPTPVIDSFQVKYPSATNVEWKVRHEKYTAAFTDSSVKKEIDFNANGSLLKEQQ